MRTSLHGVPLLAIALVLFASPCAAGPVTGRIVDPDGRGVPAAEVLLVTAGSASLVARAITSASGQFALNAPDRGEYEIRVVREGFRAKPVSVTGAGEARDLGAIALEISAVSESLVVSAAQVEIPISTAASSITVISGEDLERHQIESVADALRTVPGLAVISSGGRGALTSVFPRGGESDYSLVFIDGIQANAFGGGFDFAHLPAANIERIEVVRGPQSALYGSNAIGSVIRIITKHGGAPQASAAGEGGGFDTYRVTAATSGERRGWQWGAATEHLTTDNFNGQQTATGETVQNDDYSRHLVSAGGGWRDRLGRSIRGDVRFSRDERGFPGPFGSDPGGTYGGIDTVSRGTTDKWQMAAGGGFKVGGARVNAESTHSRSDGAFASPFRDSESSSRRTTLRAQADGALVRGLEATGGVEWLGERAMSTFITETGDAVVPVERGLTGFFGEARWSRSARLFVTGGVRIERITRRSLAGDPDGFSPRPAFDDDTVVSANPKLAVAWYVSAEDGDFTKIRGAAGTGIRPPDAFEIAFTDNPSLKPERSRSFEAGIDRALLGGRGLIEATAFFNNYDDLIVATGSFAGSSRFRTDNISNARSRGLEIAGTARSRIRAWANAAILVRAGYTLLDTEILAVDRSGQAPPPFEPGDRLLRRPKHQFSADVVLEAGRLTAFVQGGARSSVRDVDPSFGTFGGIFDAPGYAAWNTGAAWRLLRSVELFGRVTNLFDRDYEEALGFPALGRSAVMGLRVAAGR